MTEATLALTPVIRYPRIAEVGGRYLLSVDLEFDPQRHPWPYPREEYPIRFLMQSRSFRHDPIGEPVVVLHRFGGTYGPAQFALYPEQPGDAVLQIVLVNYAGVPLRTVRIDDIRIVGREVEQTARVVRLSLRSGKELRVRLEADGEVAVGRIRLPQNVPTAADFERLLLRAGSGVEKLARQALAPARVHDTTTVLEVETESSSFAGVPFGELREADTLFFQRNLRVVRIPPGLPAGRATVGEGARVLMICDDPKHAAAFVAVARRLFPRFALYVLQGSESVPLISLLPSRPEDWTVRHFERLCFSTRELSPVASPTFDVLYLIGVASMNPWVLPRVSALVVAPAPSVDPIAVAWGVLGAEGSGAAALMFWRDDNIEAGAEVCLTVADGYSIEEAAWRASRDLARPMVVWARPQETEGRTDWALVVAVKTLQGRPLVIDAESAAVEFYQWLVDPEGGGLAAKRAELLISPTRQTISRAVEEIARSARADQQASGPRRLVLYFAAPGFAVGNEFHVAAADFSFGGTPADGSLALTDTLRRIADDGAFDQIVGITHLGAGPHASPSSEVLPPRVLASAAPPTSTVVIYGGKPVDFTDLHSSATTFTKQLVAGLQGDAATPEGVVTLESLQHHLAEHTDHPHSIPEVTLLSGSPFILAEPGVAAFTPKRVLVVGSGELNPEAAEIWMATALGADLAESGHSLITGGMAGVDEIVGRSFIERLQASQNPSADRLLQIVAGSRQPVFRGGKTLSVASPLDELARPVLEADALILVGGGAGASLESELAREIDLPIYPVPGTRRNAERLWHELVEENESLRILDRPIESAGDARALTRRLVDHLGSVDTPSPAPDSGNARLSAFFRASLFVNRRKKAVERLEGPLLRAVAAAGYAPLDAERRMRSAVEARRALGYAAARDLSFPTLPSLLLEAISRERGLSGDARGPRAMDQLLASCHAAVIRGLFGSADLAGLAKTLASLETEGGLDLLRKDRVSGLRWEIERTNAGAPHKFEAALDEQARKYEEIRDRMPPSTERTAAMQAIVDGVEVSATKYGPDWERPRIRFNRGKPGDRIVALAQMIAFPHAIGAMLITEAVHRPVSYFEQWTALVAAQTMLRNLGADHIVPVVPVLLSALWTEGNPSHRTPDTDRRALCSTILMELARRENVPGGIGSETELIAALRRWLEAMGWEETETLDGR
jgi:predicted Rossmann-fold nucleotide-binding protein